MRDQAAQRWFEADLTSISRGSSDRLRAIGRNRPLGTKEDRTVTVLAARDSIMAAFANLGRLGWPSFESGSKRCWRRGRSRLRYSQIAFGLYPPTSSPNLSRQGEELSVLRLPGHLFLALRK